LLGWLNLFCEVAQLVDLKEFVLLSVNLQIQLVLQTHPQLHLKLQSQLVFKRTIIAMSKPLDSLFQSVERFSDLPR
jgi:hypothetical protein